MVLCIVVPRETILPVGGSVARRRLVVRAVGGRQAGGAARSLLAFASSPAAGFARSPAFVFVKRSLVRRPPLPQPGSPAASRRPPPVALAPVGARRLRRRPRPSDSAAGG